MNNWLKQLLDWLGVGGKDSAALSEEHIQRTKSVADEWLGKGAEILQESEPEIAADVEEKRTEVNEVHEEYAAGLGRKSIKLGPKEIAAIVILCLCSLVVCIFTLDHTVLPCFLNNKGCATSVSQADPSATNTATLPATTAAPSKPTTPAISRTASKVPTTVQPTTPSIPTVPPITPITDTHTPVPTIPILDTNTPSPTAEPPTPTDTPLPPPTTVSPSPTPITPTDTPLPPPTLPIRPTGITVLVSSGFSDQCPNSFFFTGYISADKAGTITYQWERSDGGYSSPQTLDFSGAQTLEVNPMDWRFNVFAPYSYNGWAQLRVLSPVDLISNSASFTLDCPPPPVEPTTPVPPLPTVTPTDTPTPIPAGDFSNLQPISLNGCDFGLESDGRYHIRSSRGDTGCNALYPSPYSNFQFDVGTYCYSGDGTGGGGIVFRLGLQPNGDRYFVNIARLDKQYDIAGNFGGTTSAVMGLARSDALNSPTSNGITFNQLRFVMSDKRLGIYANGELVGTFPLLNYQRGRIGLGVRTTSSNVHCAFENPIIR